MPRCKNCGKEYQVKGFCWQSCYESDILKRVIDANNDTSHTKKISKDE